MTLAPPLDRPPTGSARPLSQPPRPGVPLAPPPSAATTLCQGGIEPMQPSSPPVARLRLMGGDMDVITPDQVMAFIDRRTARGERGVVGNHNLHSLHLLRRSPTLRAFFERADLIQIDSVPLIAWGKLLGQPLERAHRSTYLDWRQSFWALADARGWRVFLLGSAPGVAQTMIDRLQPSWPQVRFACQHGYFDQGPDADENAAVVETINAFAPDVIMVGMGMPIQETWIVQNEPRLRSGVLLSVGGAFDYEAGVQIAAPRWVGRIGLEWLFRFAVQPRRLFTRYFVEPWGLIGAALADVRTAGRLRRAAGPMEQTEEKAA